MWHIDLVYRHRQFHVDRLSFHVIFCCFSCNVHCTVCVPLIWMSACIWVQHVNSLCAVYCTCSQTRASRHPCNLPPVIFSTYRRTISNCTTLCNSMTQWESNTLTQQNLAKLIGIFHTVSYATYPRNSIQ